MPKPIHTLYRRAGRVLGAGLGIAVFGAAAGLGQPAFAQNDTSPVESTAETQTLYSDSALEELVGPIALYPDDLIAIVLPASTYPLQIVQAARFRQDYERDGSLEPDENWNDSVVALLNYPEALELMNEDLDWTWSLGEAFLNQQADVFDAVQRFRDRAAAAGNLETDEHQVVREDDGVIEIVPADPKVVYVPYYEPSRVVVHHHPIHYYPHAYPLYYYPYPAGFSFSAGFFFGVTSAFVIGWDSHFLHVHHHTHFGHPYYRHRYYDPFYVRRSINVNVTLVGRGGYVWRPRHGHGLLHRRGAPHSVSIGRYEGRDRYAGRRPETRSYATRSYATRSSETRSSETRSSETRSSETRSLGQRGTRTLGQRETQASQQRETRASQQREARSLGQTRRTVQRSPGTNRTIAGTGGRSTRSYTRPETRRERPDSAVRSRSSVDRSQTVRRPQAGSSRSRARGASAFSSRSSDTGAGVVRSGRSTQRSTAGSGRGTQRSTASSGRGTQRSTAPPRTRSRGTQRR